MTSVSAVDLHSHNGFSLRRFVTSQEYRCLERFAVANEKRSDQIFSNEFSGGKLKDTALIFMRFLLIFCRDNRLIELILRT